MEMETMKKENMKKEALRRMKQLNLLVDVQERFDKEGKLYYSERLSKKYPAVLFFADDYEEIVRKVEEEYDILVYHLILTHMEFGDLLDMLYVNEEEGYWDEDFRDLKDGYVRSYCENLDDSSCSEFGTIVAMPVYGGLMRIG